MFLELWLDWLRDEIKLSEEADRPKINALFERAVKDYTCMYYLLLNNLG